MSSKKVRTLPEWAVKVQTLRAALPGSPSQEEFARRLGVSTSEVRRWEQGRRAPTPAQAIALGKAARAPDCWFWWGHAGLAETDILASMKEPAPAGRTRPTKAGAGRIAEETRAQLVIALETILERAPSAVIEEIARILIDRAGKYGDAR